MTLHPQSRALLDALASDDEGPMTLEKVRGIRAAARAAAASEPRIGLDHVADKRQLMYPVMQRSADARYGAGDLAGLAALGASGGCNSAGAR